MLEALARGSGDNISCIVAFLNSDGSTGGWVLQQRGAAAPGVPAGDARLRMALLQCLLRAAAASPPLLTCPHCICITCLTAPCLCPACCAAERVYHRGQLKYGAASARRAAVAISADEMGDTY